MSRFEDWVNRHFADDPREPASPPRPNQRSEDFEPSGDHVQYWPMQIGPDREQLRDYEPFMSSVSAGARMVEQRFSQAVEDSLAEWTEANEE